MKLLRSFTGRTVAATLLASAALVPIGIASAAGGECDFVQGRTNPSHATMNAMLDAAAREYDVPPGLLKVLAFKESSWQQFDSDGRTKMNNINRDGGRGVMQLTGATADGFDNQRLCEDTEYNIRAGAAVLRSKFAAAKRGANGTLDAALAENWYIPARFYNGSGPDAVTHVTAVRKFWRNPSSAVDWLANYVTPVRMTNPRTLITGFNDNTRLGASTNGTWRFYRLGSPTITHRVTAPVHRWTSTAATSIADVTGDGVDDILGMKKGKLYLHRGNGNGEFKTHQIRGNRGYNRDWLGAADMQGKGTLSVLGRTNGRLYRYYNNGKSDFRASAPLRKRGYNYTKLFTGHFNADTYTDLFGMKNGKLYVFINNKKGDFKARKLLGNRGYNHTWLGTTDMNSDGHDDILGITRGKLHLYTYNTKTRDYRSSKLLDNNRYTADNLLTADINYDGKADIIRETKGKLYAHNNTGKEFRKARLIESSGFNYTQLLS